MGYQKRGRDTERLSDLTSLGKSVNTYFQDFEKYPDSNAGCVDSTLLSKYVTPAVLEDPLESSDNGC